jgi:hypothetical protein
MAGVHPGAVIRDTRRYSVVNKFSTSVPNLMPGGLHAPLCSADTKLHIVQGRGKRACQWNAASAWRQGTGLGPEYNIGQT